MKLDGFANRLFCCGQRFAGSDATGEIRHIRGVVAAGIFNDNCVAHKLGPPFLQTRLLEDTVQSAWCQIVAWFARDRDPARLLRVLELAVAATGSDQIPTVLTNHAQYVSYFHDRSRLRMSYGRLTMRLSDAGMRRRETKQICSNHRLPPWLSEDATPTIARTDWLENMVKPFRLIAVLPIRTRRSFAP
jgi:hypothetical protein